MSRQVLISLKCSAVLIILCLFLTPLVLSAQDNVDQFTPGTTTAEQEPIIFPPVPDGAVWEIAQGYNSSFTHGFQIADEKYGFDFWIVSDDSASPLNSAGKPVVSGVRGKIAFVDTATNMVAILVDSDFPHPHTQPFLFAKYGHLNDEDVNKFSIGDPVSYGQILGSVAPEAGRTGQHIHFNLFSRETKVFSRLARFPEWCTTCTTQVVAPVPINKTDWAPDGSSNQYKTWRVKRVVDGGVPVADFMIGTRYNWTDSIAYVNDSVRFDGSASNSPGGQITSWDWDFGDGVRTSTTSPTVNHTYPSSGTFHPSLVVGNASGTKSVRLQKPITIRAQSQATNNIAVVLVLDGSGSMGSNDSARLRVQAAKLFIQQLRMGDKVAILGFSSSPYLLAPLTEIRTQADKANLQTQAEGVGTGGGTNIGGALQSAHNILNAGDVGIERRAVIFLTDGQGTYGNEADLFAQKNWRIYTIGLGQGQDPVLLQQIANQTGGKYYDSPVSSNLQAVYSDLVGNLTGSTNLFTQIFNLLAGQTHRIIQSIPGVPELNITVFWPGNMSVVSAEDLLNADFNLTLIDPNGNPVDINDPAIIYQKGDTYINYQLQNPLPGDWIFETSMVNGNMAYSTTLQVNTLDVVPPVGRILNTNNYVVSTQAEILLEAIDPNQPPSSQIEYRLRMNDDAWSSWTQFVPTTTVTLDESLYLNILYAEFRDSAGNTSTQRTLGMVLDTVPPDTALLLASPSGNAQSLVRFQWEGTDNILEGEADLDYSFKLEGYDTDWSAFTEGTREWTYADLVPGSYTFKVRSRDYAGNIDASPAEVDIQVQLPTGLPIIDESETFNRMFLPIVIDPNN